MSSRPSSPALNRELLSLVQHIELNKSGWWDLAVQQFVLAAIANEAHPATCLDEIHSFIKDDIGIGIQRPLLQSAVDKLSSQKKVFLLPKVGLKISEEQRESLVTNIEQSEHLQDAVKNSFVTLSAKFLPECDPSELWLEFHDGCLIPLIRALGANTLKLIKGGQVDYEREAVVAFTGAEEAPDYTARRNVVLNFLAPGDKNVREYVLRLMNASFFAEAGNVDRATLTNLTARGSHFSASIFLDTNFIFSLLDLHDNPANEAVRDLFSTIQKLGGQYQIKLYVLPTTLDEATRVISWAQDQAIRVRLEPNLIKAAVSTVGTGLIEKFLKTAQSSEMRLDASEYFGPFAKNLMTILTDKGVELYNESLEAHALKQEVIDDIVAQRERVDKGAGRRTKSYSAIEHDVVVWHYVKGRRPRADSPLQVKYWIVTLDYGFLGFDRYKAREDWNAIPVCLHPTSLAQLLQFWIPRSEEVDSAIFNAMRLPLLFPKFDSATEAVTIQILQALSKIENLSELPTGTITKIILNDGLRQRIAANPAVERGIELVKEEIVKLNQEITLKNEALQHQLTASAKQTDNLLGELQQKDNQISTLERAKDSLLRDAAEQKQRDADSKIRRNFAWRWAAICCGSAFIIGTGSHYIVKYATTFNPSKNLVATVTCGILTLVIALFVCVSQGRTLPQVAQSRMFVVLQKGMWVAWASVLLPVTCNGIWSLFEHLFFHP